MDTRTFSLIETNVAAVLLADGWHQVRYSDGISLFGFNKILICGIPTVIAEFVEKKTNRVYLTPFNQVLALSTVRDSGDTLMGSALRDYGGDITEDS